MITRKQSLSLLITTFTFWGINSPLVSAVERQSADKIPVDELIEETQQENFNDNFLDFVWWLPQEYWQAFLAQSEQKFSSEITEALLQIFEPVLIIAVVQADTSPNSVNFDFFPQETIQKGLKVTYIDKSGRTVTLTPAKEINSDLKLFLDSVQPLLASFLGNFGQNMTFFVYNNVDSSGKRIVSPYEPGELEVSLSDKKGVQRSQMDMEFPLNSLFVPRLCANGKPAHISWKYCPWDGKKLPE